MHVIRLRGPWQVIPLARFLPQSDGTYLEVEQALPAECRASMPADWSATLGSDFLGRVRYVRPFHKPTGLEPGERVFLVVEAARTDAAVTLNRKSLGQVRRDGAPLRVDVTELLGGDERLEIVVEHATEEDIGGLVGEVRLEIENEA
ncbi:MAG TPA: hypothetical protein VH107_18490 [Lacipirellulaceae bacterium]|jgi:beta-galactosidase/beta-glucuronidase|nr:hypothetical protein [Lacipirellulaceae bacterium]